MVDGQLSMRAAPRAVQDSRSSLSGKFSSRCRLLRLNGFSHVIRSESIFDVCFRIAFVQNSEKNARLGIIIGKKTLPGAVDRNRVKRIIRESFRQHSIKQCSLDIVVMLRRAIPQNHGEQAGNLKLLFSRVESRCAEL